MEQMGRLEKLGRSNTKNEPCKLHHRSTFVKLTAAETKTQGEVKIAFLSDRTVLSEIDLNEILYLIHQRKAVDGGRLVGRPYKRRRTKQRSSVKGTELVQGEWGSSEHGRVWHCQVGNPKAAFGKHSFKK